MSQQHGARPDAATMPGSGGVGATVTQILTLAEAESAEVRHNATRLAEAIVAEARVAADELRTQADRYAVTKRAASELDATTTLDQAQSRADGLLREAEERLRDAREQAERVREQAHSDVETIEERRAQLERDLRERLELARGRAEVDRATVRELRAIEESIRAEHDRTQLAADEARARTSRLIAEAADEAALAQTRLGIELADARRRRDAIHAHLAAIGTMLGELSGEPPRLPVFTAARRSRGRRAAPRYKWVLAGGRRAGRDPQPSDPAARQGR